MQIAWFLITVLKLSGRSLTQFDPVQSKVKIECLLHTGCAMKGLVQTVIKVTPPILRTGVLQTKPKRPSREDRHVHGNDKCGTLYKRDYKKTYNSFTVLINNLFTIQCVNFRSFCQ